MKKKGTICVMLTKLFTIVTCNKLGNDFDSVNINYIEKRMRRKNFVLVDARHNSFFIGNTSDKIMNGGHIKGATDFSAAWLDVKDVDKKLEETMNEKGITTFSEVVVYSDDDSESKRVAQFFSEKGVTNVKIFNSKNYINNDLNPKLVSYKNFQYFIPAYGVNEILNGNDYQNIKADNTKFFEVSWGDEKTSYAKGHIPTSVHINTDEIESAPLWSLKSDEQLFQFIADNGIKKSDTIILSSSENHMAACRIAYILRYLGVVDVHILNGGTTAFEKAGYKLEKNSNPKQKIRKSDINSPLNTNLIDTKEDVTAMLKNQSGLLIDARTKDEWSGNTSGYSDLENKGRIKGAIYHGGIKTRTTGDVFDYTNVDNTMRNFDEVLTMWKNAGIDYNKHLSFYCGSGWRVSEIAMYATTYGLKNISICSNGWYEWSNCMRDNIKTYN